VNSLIEEGKRIGFPETAKNFCARQLLANDQVPIFMLGTQSEVQQIIERVQ